MSKPEKTVSTNELNERARQLLKTLVECYIRDGQPVGSRTLSRSSDLDLSPATIRNVMADLEELGLVMAPHTSAGRIPTPQGYRIFIDSLLTVQNLGDAEVERLRRQLNMEGSVPEMLDRVSKLLSGVTHMAGLVTVPRREQCRLRHVEFLKLSEDRVLAIFVVNESEVRNYVVHTGRAYTATELEQAGNYFNAQYTGKNLDEARAGVLQAMREAKEAVNALMQAAMEAAELAISQETQRGDYKLAGQTNLMTFPEFSDLAALRQLFEAFNEKQDLLHLLDQCVRSGGVQIFIGEESGYKVLGGCSLITSTYQVEGKPLGVLGVIGPTRMAYERVIPIVDVTAKLLGAALNPRQ